jgi:hypothetical protein
MKLGMVKNHRWPIFILLVPLSLLISLESGLLGLIDIPLMEYYWVVVPPQSMSVNLIRRKIGEQLSTQHIIDEAHYNKTRRPRGPQIIMYMGY